MLVVRRTTTHPWTDGREVALSTRRTAPRATPPSRTMTARAQSCAVFARLEAGLAFPETENARSDCAEFRGFRPAGSRSSTSSGIESPDAVPRARVCCTKSVRRSIRHETLQARSARLRVRGRIRLSKRPSSLVPTSSAARQDVGTRANSRSLLATPVVSGNRGPFSCSRTCTDFVRTDLLCSDEVGTSPHP